MLEAYIRRQDVIHNEVSNRKRLSPWVIVRLLPNMQRVIVGRFRTRSDADGHLQILQRLLPTAQMKIVFDVDDQP